MEIAANALAELIILSEADLLVHSSSSFSAAANVCSMCPQQQVTIAKHPRHDLASSGKILESALPASRSGRGENYTLLAPWHPQLTDIQKNEYSELLPKGKDNPCTQDSSSSPVKGMLWSLKTWAYLTRNRNHCSGPVLFCTRSDIWQPTAIFWYFYNYTILVHGLLFVASCFQPIQYCTVNRPSRLRCLLLMRQRLASLVLPQEGWSLRAHTRPNRAGLIEIAIRGLLMVPLRSRMTTMTQRKRLKGTLARGSRSGCLSLYSISSVSTA
jgi:hypothetical protein